MIHRDASRNRKRGAAQYKIVELFRHTIGLMLAWSEQARVRVSCRVRRGCPGWFRWTVEFAPDLVEFGTVYNGTVND